MNSSVTDQIISSHKRCFMMYNFCSFLIFQSSPKTVKITSLQNHCSLSCPNFRFDLEDFFLGHISGNVRHSCVSGSILAVTNNWKKSNFELSKFEQNLNVNNNRATTKAATEGLL